jgi:acetylornithine deacetylase/succinyl-diaminopimelate desuccinylase-like protein
MQQHQQRGIAALIEEQFEEQVAFLQRMVRCRSTNGFTPEASPPDAAVEEQVAGVICEQMQHLGLPASLVGVSRGRPNVVCYLPGRDPSARTLILTTHMDTVEPSGDYTRDPFGGEIDGGRLYGVGAADAKAQIAGFVYAASALRRAGVQMRGHLHLAFVVDEESGACSPYGTRYLLEQGVLTGDAAIVGEAGDRKIATGHRGVYRFRLQTSGEGVHTGTREWEEGTRGHNAAVDMARLSLALADCTLPYRPSPSFPGRRPVLTFPTLIRGGSSVNLVPDLCEAYGDIRLLPGASEALTRQALEACLRQHPGISYRLETVAFVPPAEISVEAEIVQSLAASAEAVTGLQPRREGGGPACDGWMFIARGIPAVCGYGADYGGVHAADEWADLGSLRRVTEVYARTAMHYLGVMEP